MTDISFSQYSGLVLRHHIEIIKRELMIVGEIRERTYVRLDKQLKLLENNEGDITLVLNSVGGDIPATFAIIDRIVMSPCNIHIIGTGNIMSAALSILVSGTTKRATKYTNFMHHGLSSFTHGYENVPTKEHELKICKEMDRMRFKHLSENTKKPYSFWSSTGKHLDHMFNADLALEYGLIDEIL